MPLSTLIAVLAGAVLTGAAVYILIIIAAAWRRESAAAESAALEHRLLRERIEAAAQRSRVEREADELSWNGLRKFSLARKVTEAEGIASFYLVAHDGRPLPPFKPGQYLTFSLRLPGSDKPLVRCYSLSEAPESRDHYRVTIKKVPPGPGHEQGGRASTFFHDVLKVGDIVDVKAPSGKFHLDAERSGPVVLIGSGVGLTPVLSMLNSIASAKSGRETWFFYGVPDGRHHAMKDHLKALAKDNPNVRLHVSYSKPGPGDVADSDFHHSGRFSVDVLKRLLPSSNYDYYLCGPSVMMDETVAGLKAWGVPESSIHFESFGSGTAKALAPASDADSGQLEVTFARSKRCASWTPASGSLLDLAEAAGITIPSGCRTGNCGTCITAVQSGMFDYLVQPGSPPEKGSCLACVTRPKSALTLDA